jgi:hypothetical protein
MPVAKGAMMVASVIRPQEGSEQTGTINERVLGVPRRCDELNINLDGLEELWRRHVVD